MSPLKSQLLGLALGLATAIGCIAYEKIVKHFSFGFGIIVALVLVYYSLFLGYVLLFQKAAFVSDLTKLANTPSMIWWCIVYMITGVTCILWYTITKSQSVMTGSIYEVKYIVMLALLYIMFGENKFTLNTVIGVTMAVGSIYFISKS